MHVHTHKYNEDVLSIMVNVIRNGIHDPSSKPGLRAYVLGKTMNPSVTHRQAIVK